MTDWKDDLDLKRDRFGHNGITEHCSRLTFMAFARGYVMVRRPGAMPFVITETLWRSFPCYEKNFDLRKAREEQSK